VWNIRLTFVDVIVSPSARGELPDEQVAGGNRAGLPGARLIEMDPR
jgi:hypothetical protein